VTCDGLRALLQCGFTAKHPRVIAARRWLEQNFSVASNPGVFQKDREVLRDAYYYYYAWSLAHALMALNVHEVQTPKGPQRWAGALSRELIRRQNRDGSWANPYTDAKEDDPLVATPFAISALIICQYFLGEGS